MNPHVVWALFRKDIQDSFKNYQILLMVATPILLSLLFSSIFTETKSKALQPKIGVMASPMQPLLERFKAEKFGVKIQFFQDRKSMEAKVVEGEVGFGLILPDSLNASGEAAQRPRLTLIYPAQAPEYAVERMHSALDQEIRGILGIPLPPLPVEISLEPIGGSGPGSHSFSGDLFPMLVLMAMGMVGFLGLPLSFVEEKERRTLYALFLTPTSSEELILGKSLFSLFLILLTIFAMVVLNNRWEGSILLFWTFAISGSLLCIFIGLIIALVAENQASVNAIGTSLFMFFQLVPNLSKTSEIMKSLSPLVPSTFISNGIKKSMFLDLSMVNIKLDLGIVLALTLTAYLLVFLVFKYRRTNI